MPHAYIYDCLRTPRGRAKATGSLHEVAPHELLATLLREVASRRPDALASLTDCLIGCVAPVGDQGYNVAQAALQAAGLPQHIAAAQVGRYCASGLETVHQAAARISAGYDEAILCGGVESMGRVPLASDGGALLTDPELILDTMTIPQGVAADLIATDKGIAREELDALALRSQQLAATAKASGHFAKSLVPVADETGQVLLAEDEYNRPTTDAEGLAALPPAFAKTGAAGFDALALRRYPHLAAIDHQHTAGNSSGLVDGAAIAVVGSDTFASVTGQAPRARIRSVAVASSDPTMMLMGAIPATALALKRASVNVSDLDLIEVNEAFAAIPLTWIRHFNANAEHVNVNGGAIALGHPVGATGAILLGTLVDELERRDKTLGLVTLCAGGGQGIAAVVERV